MKNITILVIFIISICTSCTTINYPNHPKWLCSKKYACLKHPRLETPLIVNELIESYDNSSNDKIYEDFPYEDTTYSSLKYKNSIREGQILNGYKEGLWLSAIYKYDTVKKTKEIDILFTEEYFKKGLRDSIFKQYDDKRNLIYSTYFKMGTGLWKEFHKNGKIYFDIQTKDGYFTDTLKLYNDKGKLMEKRLYKKDSLVYHENFIFDENPNDNK
jgi:antitoxin component YwqK of YwqJK toxin-antitoxin module